MRLLVTGSRDLTDPAGRALVQNALTEHGAFPLILVVGDCPTGADRYARAWGRQLADDVEVYQADWAINGKAAGPLRNQAMVDGGADLCLAFWRQGAGNRGTQDCVRRARIAGIPVVEFTEPKGAS